MIYTVRLIRLEALLNEGVTEKVKILISDLTNRFNEISSKNQLELGETL